MDLNKDLLVTIGIPTFDRFEYLKEAVDCALAQTWANIEVLVGDDGTTAEIPQWCEQRARLEPRLRYQRNSPRRGLAGNWNSIAQRARGEFIIFQGDDDRLLPDFVERCLRAAQPETKVIFSNHHLIDPHGTRLATQTEANTREFHRAELAPGRVAEPEVIAWQMGICPSAVLTRTSDVLRLGFREELNSPDTEFFIRLAAEHARFDFVPEYLSELRVHGASMTATGLRHDLLAAALLDLPASREAEPWKRAFFEIIMINAVSRSLLDGNMARARKFLSSPYYPPRGRLGTRGLQRLCAALPFGSGREIYRATHFVKQRLKA